MVLLSILLQTTPETSDYMVLGYAVFFIVMLAYLASLILRHRNLKQDMAALQDAQHKDS